MTMHLAGGTGGMEGAFQKFGDRDNKSTDRARRMMLGAEHRRTLIDGVEAASEGRSIQELEARRDALLMDLYRLKAAGSMPNA